ncbi:15-anhydro-D-fructose reductase protein [Marine Group I thaumarchaeote SCGC AAA799-E16]|uniref:D-xylose 1-dehydrogenase protein n=2 Tax=Marine Group I TaxID=905826 RepID=A0A087S258_9ARCH|nr:15-anhydro-D-fructose reductase protein [Marine Group I thaumarchaeote SCGC AAA799-E16]KFM19812.1 D-xylose 1-dehydrogenase protein [Marine Group I thaumarchaeote SCGC RSA3]
MNKIRMGIIGCSRIADSSVIPAIISSEFSELGTLGSRKMKRAKEFADKFDCKNFGTYEDVINDDKIDAVYISTPVGTHEEWTIKSLKAGKHVLCEKSSTGNYESAKKMISTAKENNLRILEGLMFRFHPSHAKILELIQSNTIGEMFSFYGEYGFPDVPHTDIRYKKELGGGILNDAGCYPICASRIIFGQLPKEAFCELIIDKESNVDVKASITLKYSENQIANMVVGYGLRYQSKYSVWGQKGHIQLSRAYNIPPKMSPQIVLQLSEKEERILLEPENHFRLMIDNFCQEISGNKESLFDFEGDFLIQAAIMEACRKSFLEKRSVNISEIK